MARAKRQPPEINAGSMADIAFLLLIFFLVTTTMDTDTGLLRALPPMPPPGYVPPKVNDRNIFKVLVNANNQLLVEDQPMELSELRKATKEFIENPGRLETLPEFETVDVPFFGTTQVSKQIVSLKNDRKTSYDTYIRVQNELAAAYNELRNDLAKRKFGKSFDELIEDEEDDKVDAIKKVYPQRISEAEPVNIGG